MKRVLSLCLCVCLLLSLFSVAGLAANQASDAGNVITVALSATEPDANGGIQVTVTLTPSQTTNVYITAYTFTLSYDDAVVIPDMDAEGALSKTSKGVTTYYGVKVDGMKTSANFTTNSFAGTDGTPYFLATDANNDGFNEEDVKAAISVTYFFELTEAAKTSGGKAEFALATGKDGDYDLFTVSTLTDDGLIDALGAEVSTSVAVPMSAAAISGTITTPAKGASDATALTSTNANVDIALVWSPALIGGAFAANTAYTATVTVTPKEGCAFAADATVTDAGSNGLTYARQADGSYTASKTFPATAAKSLVSISATDPTSTTYIYGDEFDKSTVVVTGTYDDASTDTVTDYTVTYASGTAFAVGDTSVTLTYGDKETTVTGLTVSPKSIADAVITLGTQAVYSGAEQNVVIDSVVLGDVTLASGTDYTVTAGGAATNVANTTLTITGAGNYTGTASTTWTLQKAAPALADFSVTAPADGIIYSGEAASVAPPTSEKTGMGTVTVKYDGGSDAPSAAGSYAVTFDVAEGSNYSAATGLSIGTLTIGKKSVTISGVTVENKPYDGETAAVLDASSALVDGAVTGDDVTVAAGSAAFSDAYAGTGKTVSFTGFALDGEDAENYELSAQPTAVTADITAADQEDLAITTTRNLVKGGKTLDLSTLVTGAIGDVSFEIASGTAATLSGSVLTSDAENTGDVVITVTVAAKDLNADGINEYNADSGTITVSVVDKVDAGAVVNSGADLEKTYGDAAFQVAGTVTTPGEGTGVWTWASSNESVATVAADGTVTILAPGSATLTGTYESDTAIGSDDVSLTVAKKTITITGITATDRAYDGTTTVDITGGDLVGLVDGDTVTPTVPTTGTVSSADAADAAKAVTLAADITLSGADADKYTLTQPTGITVKITPAKAFLGWYNSDNSSYTDNPVTYTYTGAVQNPPVPKAVNAGGAVVSVSVAEKDGKDFKNADTYTYVPTCQDSNYVLEPAAGTSELNLTLSIEKVVLTPAVDTVDAKTYDETTAATGTLTLSGAINGEAPTATGTFQWVSADAGTDKVNVTIALDSANTVNANYKLSVESLSNVEAAGSSIAKAAQADFKFAESTLEKTYGDASFTVAATGSKNADAVYYVSSDTEVAAVVRATGEVTILKSGEAVITAYSPENTNYLAAEAAYTLTVAKAKVTVTVVNKSIYIGEAIPELQYNVEGLVGQDALDGEISYSYEKSGAAVEELTSTEAAVFTIIPGGLTADGDKYDVDFVSGTLTVQEVIEFDDEEESSGSGSGSSPSGTTGDSASDVVTEDTTVTITAEDLAENKIVTLDILAEASENAETAPEITIELPADSGSVKVEIPVEEVSASSVIILVSEDGTEKVLPKTAISDDGILLEIDGTVTVKVVENKKTYSDVSDSYWGSDAIGFVSARELFNGVEEGVFDPSGTMTRAMLVTVLYRLEGEQDTAFARTFRDVTGDKWYSDAVAWASDNGIVEGYEDGNFGTDDPVTREQIAVMLWRMMGEPAVSGTAVTGASAWAEDAMQWAISIGLIQGDGTGYNATGTATRAETATLLMRFINLLFAE